VVAFYVVDARTHIHQILKNTRIKFQENPLGGSSIVPMRSHRRADVTKLNSRFSQFCERMETVTGLVGKVAMWLTCHVHIWETAGSNASQVIGYSDPGFSLFAPEVVYWCFEIDRVGFLPNPSHSLVIWLHLSGWLCVYSVRNVVAHGDAREGKWRGNWSG